MKKKSFVFLFQCNTHIESNLGSIHRYSSLFLQVCLKSPLPLHNFMSFSCLLNCLFVHWLVFFYLTKSNYAVHILMDMRPSLSVVDLSLTHIRNNRIITGSYKGTHKQSKGSLARQFFLQKRCLRTQRPATHCPRWLRLLQTSDIGVRGMQGRMANSTQKDHISMPVPRLPPPAAEFKRVEILHQ